MLHTSCNTYHVQFGFLKHGQMQNTELDSSLNPDNALALIFLKEAKFTQGLNKISHIGSMAKLRATTTATAFLKIFFQKDKGVLRIQFVLSFGRRRGRRRRKSAFDIRPLAWAIILNWGCWWVGGEWCLPDSEATRLRSLHQAPECSKKKEAEGNNGLVTIDGRFLVNHGSATHHVFSRPIFHMWNLMASMVTSSSVYIWIICTFSFVFQPRS